MRILFIGAVDFSRHCLMEILRWGGNVVAILSVASSRSSGYSDFSDLSDIAETYKIPIYKLVTRIGHRESIDLVTSLTPDIIFVFGWSELIPKELLGVPPLGCIGSHPALLPKNRGRHPLIWALVEGLTESGLTFFYIDEGTDSGDILWQKSFEITLQDDAKSLYNKIIELATEAIRDFLPKLQDGTAPRLRQNASKASYWRKRSEKDGEIDWSRTSLSIYNLIRALTRPYVGAHTYLNNVKFTVWRARLSERKACIDLSRASPGLIVAKRAQEIDVRTGDGYLTLLEYEAGPGDQAPVGSILGGWQ